VRIIGVPYHLGEYLPDLDLPLQLQDLVTVCLQAGDVWQRLAALYAAVGQAVAASIRQGDRPVVVSGDCTTALGTMAGLQGAGMDAGIVWFDAHGDVQTLETTASGYLGGLPLRLLTGYRPELLGARLGLQPVPEQRVVLVGARDLDPPEVTYLAGAQVRRSDVADLKAADLKAADLKAADLPARPLYVHLDLDVITPDEVPGLRFPAPGGPGSGQVADALRMVLSTDRVAAVGIACTWYPGHGAAARLAACLEGIFAVS
jgi:arginase